MRFIVLAAMVLAFLALLWDRSVAHKDRETFEENRKPSALADDVYEALLDFVESKAQPPVEEQCVQLLCDTGELAKGHQSKKSMLRNITRGVEC